MGQTKEGAIKTAAKRAGISVAEYTRRIEADLKKCTKCKDWKSRKEYNQDRSRGDGLKASCAKCNSVHQDQTHPSIRQRKIMRQKGMSWCRRCLEWLASEKVDHNGFCRYHANQVSREYYSRNRYSIRRRCYLRKRGVDDVPEEGIRILMQQFEGGCAYCGEDAETLDHIEPVSKGGQTIPGNIVPACKSCNSSKKDLDVVEWMEKKGHEASEQFLEIIAMKEAVLLRSA